MDADVWDPRALAYQRSLLTSIRTRVICVDALSQIAREQCVRVAYEGGDPRSHDVFEGAALARHLGWPVTDAQVEAAQLEAFLWATCKRPYRCMPAVNLSMGVLEGHGHMGVQLAKLVTGFCRLDVIWQWRCDGRLTDSVRRSLVVHLDRPRLAPPTELERALASALHLPTLRYPPEPGAFRSLQSVREAREADRVAALVGASEVGRMWLDVLGPRAFEVTTGT